MEDQRAPVKRPRGRLLRNAAVALGLVAALGVSGAPGAGPAHVHAKKLKIGYVLHILIPFTEQIAQGAKDAAADYGMDIQVVGPPAFSAPQEIAYFNGFVQQGVDGIVIVPNPPEAYPVVIKKAVKAGIPVESANVISPRAGIGWFGQAEYNSGILLANTLLKSGLKGKSGTVVVGSCAPGVSVLAARYNGVASVLKKQAALKVVGPFDVTGNPATNYSAWQSLYTAHTDAVAMVGLCALDNPDLAQLKRKYHAGFLAAGYDNEPAALRGIKAGQVTLTVGQNPYLQGYLPVKAIAEHLLHGKPLITGWINTGTEIVTKSNIDFYIKREGSASLTRSYYAKQIKGKFADLNALQQPYPSGS